MRLALALLLIAASALVPTCTASMTTQELSELRNSTVQLFKHAFGSYMKHAFPMDELLPLSCQGTNSFGGVSVTLIDSLDTLAVMGLRDEFAAAVEAIRSIDVTPNANISVFEANIRLLGGLLSAHVLASDEKRDLIPGYDGFLLRKAAQLGKALSKAFVSPTGIPHGSLNLRGGVVPGESNMTATATAGTLLLEFSTLSRLTQTPTYTFLAHSALSALLQRRSAHGLLGGHIDITNGIWSHRTSSLGSGSDSLYEYLLKSALLLGSSSSLDLMTVFTEVRAAIKRHLYQRPWYKDIDYETLSPTIPLLDALQAFWPGIEFLSGNLLDALDTMMAFTGVWQLHGCLPEGYNIIEGRVADSRPSSPLRPELIESAL